MSNIAIGVEHLSKQYRIGGVQASYRTIRDTLMDVVTKPIKRAGRILQGEASGASGLDQVFWALKDVSFEVKPGEIIGIIGRNGAGKSTLLKILSRITEPSDGRVRLFGRVGSLLEVGTGFHPELTGRENIFLNGAILGMHRAEIERKFDEIVDFAEIEKFIDTPVKHYSSGMYLRLAFAVAAHLEPEILLMDEVLAVGDAAFQKKCLGKMADVATDGRTVLFVSHNMPAITRLCQRVIWLADGQIHEQGETARTVSNYIQAAANGPTERSWESIETAPGNEQFRLKRAAVYPTSGEASEQITMLTSFAIEFDYWNLKPDCILNLSVQVFDSQGVNAFTTVPDALPQWMGVQLAVGLYRSRIHIPAYLLNNGLFTVQLFAVENMNYVIYAVNDILSFEVIESPEVRGISTYNGPIPGVFHPKLKWDIAVLDPIPS